MREWMIRHPDAVGAVLALAGAWLAVMAYDYGRAIGGARALASETARLRSEALGG